MALGLTHDELAQVAGCAPATIREIEGARRQPARHVLARLTAVLTMPDAERLSPMRRRRRTLPARLTSFVGREQEQRDLVALLENPDTRLVTITGPGGSGKTRLALQAAEALADTFPDGCCFVDLAPIGAPQQVAAAVAGTLDPHLAAERVVEYLRRKKLLLLLDNYEHLIAAAGFVGELLAAPHVTILVTSRVALQLYGEQEFPLAPLEVPPPHAPRETILASDAVRLFLARSGALRQADPPGADDLAAIAAICRKLDGLPLAIELAAARATREAPAALLARLETQGALTVLAGGPRNIPARQQAIRATIAWSYDLLDPVEQEFFGALGVFAGQFDAEAAGAVCGADTPALLDSLAEHNLLQRAPAGFFMLETIRAYALEQLQRRGIEAQLRDRHLRYYAALAEAAEPQLRRADSRRWFARLDSAAVNMHAALSWSLTQGGDAGAGVRLLGALWYYWRGRGRFGDAAVWYGAPALTNEAIPAAARARALAGLAWVAERQGNYSRMFPLAHAALTAARAAADPITECRARILVALDDHDPPEAAEQRRACAELVRTLDDPWLRCQAIRWFGRPPDDAPATAWRRFWSARERLASASGDPWLMCELLGDRFHEAFVRRDLPEMRRTIAQHEAIAREMQSPQALALAYEGRARVAVAEGRWSEALVFQQDRRRIERDLDNRNGIAWSALEIASLHMHAGEFAPAEAAITEAFENLQAISEQRGLAWAYGLRCLIGLWQGDYGAAEAAGAASLAIARSLDRRIDSVEWSARALWSCAIVALAQGDLPRAEVYLAEGAELMQSIDDDLDHRLDTESLRALIAALAGDAGAAAERIAELVARYRARGDIDELIMGMWCQAPILLAAGEIAGAEACCREGLAVIRNIGDSPWALQLIETRAVCAGRRNRWEEAARWWGAAAALREQIGAPRWPLARPAAEQQIAAAQQQLTPAAEAAAEAAGAALGWEELIDLPCIQPSPTGATQALIARELATAAAIQAGLLPTELPEPDGWSLAATLVPARETAGDFYDCFLLPDGRLGLVIADVAGKGLGPALYMATGRALIRTLVADGHVDPVEILTRVNAHLLTETRADLFITLFYGLLDPAEGVLCYANAGHPPPLIAAAGEPQVRSLAPTGLVLGVELDVEWRQECAQLAPGDLLLLYTDGVTEADDGTGSFFDTERLIDALRACGAGAAGSVVDGVLTAVRSFVGAAPQADDITLLALAWRTPP
jgi:predicted ATPase